jgi:hypothetical protein
MSSDRIPRWRYGGNVILGIVLGLALWVLLVYVLVTLWGLFS